MKEVTGLPYRGPRYAVQAIGLTKRYGSHAVVRDVSFGVRPGSVTGFLGPNGAGKSTTLRMLVGLTQPSAGRCTILGSDYRRLAAPGRSVGVLLDASAQHAGRTGREVLALSALLMGLDERRVDEVLEMVGLTPAEARRRTGVYSLGMRQRLGVGHALLGSPRVLILDEPANGLDPSGIQWMRHLLRDFADRGGSVLLSSHLLREVEVVADQLVVISGGRIVESGATDELLAAAGTLVRSPDGSVLARALAAAGLAHSPADQGRYLVQAPAEQVARVAADAGVVVTELREAASSGLEELFLRLTADDARDSEAREGATR